jgi:hypothetical protein
VDQLQREVAFQPNSDAKNSRVASGASADHEAVEAV